jgi:hypothetical protein
MEYIYEELITHFDNKVIKRTDLDGNDSWVPLDPANSDYQEYLASLEATEPEAE